MSRSNYSEDYDEEFANALALYRSSVDQAINGKRGQAFLKELLAALEAMPDKRLISGDLQLDTGVCAIGSVGLSRGIDMTKMDPEDDRSVGKVFGIAPCMVREIVYENDEGLSYRQTEETPENRWRRMRDWAAENLKTPIKQGN